MRRIVKRIRNTVARRQQHFARSCSIFVPRERERERSLNFGLPTPPPLLWDPLLRHFCHECHARTAESPLSCVFYLAVRRLGSMGVEWNGMGRQCLERIASNSKPCSLFKFEPKIGNCPNKGVEAMTRRFPEMHARFWYGYLTSRPSAFSLLARSRAHAAQ